MKGIRLHLPQDVPIQPEGLPSDHQKIAAGLPCANLKMIPLAGQMAGATSETLRSKMPLPLRFQGLRASEPTLRRRAPSGSPPLLVSSAHRPRWQFFHDRRRCLAEIFGRCDWVGRDRGAPVAPPAADDPTGAPPHLEGVGGYHLHLGHLSLVRGRLAKASPTRPRGGGHRDV